MLRMDGFDVVVANSYPEARALWNPEAMYCAGGTDLLPNLKHRLFRPRTVIHLGGIPGGATLEGEELVIGAGMTLAQLAEDPTVRTVLPPLSQAAGVVAGPQLRNMGTIGGNVLLDTRCLYYNQTEFWRKSLGYCLKAEGTWCHVVGGPKTCVATQSSDTVPVLLAADASIVLLGANGERILKMRDLYRYNGMDHLQIEKGELLKEIRIPKPPEGFRGSYQKLRTRASIDFPQLGVAIAGQFDGEVLLQLQIVIGAVNPQPKPVRGMEEFCGRPLENEGIQAICDKVFQQTRPQGSVHGDVTWRRQMAQVFVRRGLENLRHP